MQHCSPKLDTVAIVQLDGNCYHGLPVGAGLRKLTRAGPVLVILAKNIKIYLFWSFGLTNLND